VAEAKQEVARRARKLDGLLEKLSKDDSTLWTAFSRVEPFDDYAARIDKATPPILTIELLPVPKTPS
jgi:hypothetical protein